MVDGWIGEYECPNCGAFDVLHPPGARPQRRCWWCSAKVRLVKRRDNPAEMEKADG